MIIPPYDTKSVRDWIAFTRQFDTFWQTATNGAVLVSLRTLDIAAGATYYYGLRVPAGRLFVLYQRKLTVTEGRYHIDVCIPSGGFTGGTPALVSTLRAGASQTVTTGVWGGVTPSGTITERTNGFVDTGVTPGTAGVHDGATGSDTVIKMFGEGDSLLRVVQTPSSGVWTANLELIGWELDV